MVAIVRRFIALRVQHYYKYAVKWMSLKIIRLYKGLIYIVHVPVYLRSPFDCFIYSIDFTYLYALNWTNVPPNDHSGAIRTRHRHGLSFQSEIICFYTQNCWVFWECQRPFIIQDDRYLTLFDFNLFWSNFYLNCLPWSDVPCIFNGHSDWMHQAPIAHSTISNLTKDQSLSVLNV